MKSYNVLVFISGLVAVSAQSYQKQDLVLDLDKVALGNDAACGKVTEDIKGLYQDFTITGATVVNTTKTDKCPSPVGSTSLDGLKGDNILYGSPGVAFFLAASGPSVPSPVLAGSALFDVSLDIDSLGIKGDFSIYLELTWILKEQALAANTFTFSLKDNGQPPYRVNATKENIAADTFRMSATVFDGTAVYSKDYSLGLYNFDFALLVPGDPLSNGTTSSKASSHPTSTTSSKASSRQTPGTTSSTVFSSNSPPLTTTPTSTDTANDSQLTPTAPASTTKSNAGFHLAPSCIALVALWGTFILL